MTAVFFHCEHSYKNRKNLYKRKIISCYSTLTNSNNTCRFSVILKKKTVLPKIILTEIVLRTYFYSLNAKFI